MALPNNTIEKIKLPGITVPYDVAAKYIAFTEGGTTNYYNWGDIRELIKAGFTILVPWTKEDYNNPTAPSSTKLGTIPSGVKVKYNYGGSEVAGTLPASGEDTQHHIYLVYHPHDDTQKDNFDEYVSTGTTWEKIGNTDIDLSGYAQKGEYQTDAGGAGNTGSAGAVSKNTGSAASVTITPTLNFTGSSTTHTVNFGKTGVTVGDHAAATLNVSGSQDISHEHSLSGLSHTSGKFMDWDKLNVNGGSLTSGGTTTVVTDVTYEQIHNAVTNVRAYAPTVSDGVLSFQYEDAPVTTATVVVGVNQATTTVNKSYTYTAASISSTETTPTVYDFINHSNNIKTGGATLSVNGSNFKAALPKLTHTVGTEFSASVTIAPEGTISGNVIVPAHTHSITIDAHTHTIGSHTHDIEIRYPKP